ncbi:putative short-chain dehydrogenase [Clohesyomyces aquaticus]|uniref:Putative short-chain dehydrogenase n=1 Tax=Clohesyomyces aquaticus TaxID=1231657 RepID=A0A1Y1Z2D2_9PLEO|nr:putative short-chain dehydrogenase [Clohesyomyces aquaticus]
MASKVRASFERTGRNYIVTGGAQGIGLALTQAIAEMGGNVAILDLQDKPLNHFSQLANTHGVKLPYFRADVANERSFKVAFKGAVEALGSVDSLMTSAGIALEKPFGKHTWDEVNKILEVTGTFMATQLFAEQVEKQGKGGSAVLIASITSHTVLPSHRMSAYPASKELAPLGIRVNSISPGFIDTEQTKFVRDHNAKIADLMFNAPPLKRIGTTDDLVGSVVYLLSDASSYTTGTDIAITGALHVGRQIDT